MDSINVNLSVIDCCFSKCQNSSISTTKVFTSFDDFIALHCNYFLKIISVEDNFIVISINNNLIFYVRKAYVGIPIKICLSNSKVTHQITIQVNSITLILSYATISLLLIYFYLFQ